MTVKFQQTKIKIEIERLYSELNKLEKMSISTDQKLLTALHCKVHDKIEEVENQIEIKEKELIAISQ